MTYPKVLMGIHGGESQTQGRGDLWASEKRWMCRVRNVLLAGSGWGRPGRVRRLAWNLQKHLLPPPLLQQAGLCRNGSRYCLLGTVSLSGNNTVQEVVNPFHRQGSETQNSHTTWLKTQWCSRNSPQSHTLPQLPAANHHHVSMLRYGNPHAVLTRASQGAPNRKELWPHFCMGSCYMLYQQEMKTITWVIAEASSKLRKSALSALLE